MDYLPEGFETTGFSAVVDDSGGIEFVTSSLFRIKPVSIIESFVSLALVPGVVVAFVVTFGVGGLILGFRVALGVELSETHGFLAVPVFSGGSIVFADHAAVGGSCGVG